MSKAFGRIGLANQKAGYLPRLMPLIVVLLVTLMGVEFDLDRKQGVAAAGSVQEGELVRGCPSSANRAFEVPGPRASVPIPEPPVWII